MPPIDPIRSKWASVADFTRDVFEAATGAGLSAESAALLTAQVCHEVGPDRRHDRGPDKGRLELETGDRVWGFNLTGIKAVGSQPYHQRGTREWNGREYVTIDPRKVHWRTFDSLDDWLRTQLGLLRGWKYRAAWTALERGSHLYFTELRQGPERLGRPGWYTAPIDDYWTGCCRRLVYVCDLLGLPLPLAARACHPHHQAAILKERGQTVRELQADIGAPVDGDWGPITSWYVVVAAGEAT